MNIAEAEKVLFLKGTYGEEELRKAYRKMIAQYHPDKFATQSDEMKNMAAEKMKEINEANKLLKTQVAGGKRLTVGENGSTSSSASSTASSTSTPKTYTYVPPKDNTSVSTTSHVDPPKSQSKPESTPKPATTQSSSTARKVYSDPVDVSKTPEVVPESDAKKSKKPFKKREKKEKIPRIKKDHGKQAKEDFKQPTTVILTIVAIVALVLAVWGVPTLIKSLGIGNAVAGCSWTDIEVVDSGFTQTPEGKTSIAVAVKNNNAEHSLRYVTVKVNVFDINDQMISSTKIRTSGTVLPGGIAYGSTEDTYKVNDTPALIGRIECSIEENSTSFVENAPDTYQQELTLGEWTLDSVNELGTKRHLVATAINPNAYAFSGTIFDVVFQDADGHPLYVYSCNGGGVGANGAAVTIDTEISSLSDGTWSTFIIRPSATR